MSRMRRERSVLAIRAASWGEVQCVGFVVVVVMERVVGWRVVRGRGWGWGFWGEEEEEEEEEEAAARDSRMVG